MSPYRYSILSWLLCIPSDDISLSDDSSQSDDSQFLVIFDQGNSKNQEKDDSNDDFIATNLSVVATPPGMNSVI